ncbi:MAG: SDR family oxidoreductase [Alphaproteobacteria bacterium]|nr:SDR family oxidoreductase [Alphaproteobacteria bacterium]
MSDRWIIVTGGSRGIGAAIAVDLVARGEKVAALSRSGNAPAGRGIACDVTDSDALAGVIAGLAAEGGIGGLVNNAGRHVAGPAASLEATELDGIFHTNATAPFVVCRLVYPHLKQGGGGVIINIGSFFDKLGVVNNLAYASSKAALGAITRCLAVEWAGDGIRVLNVAPGYVETDLNRTFLADETTRAWLTRRVPLRRPAKPEEIGRLVAWLIVGDVPFLTGETIYVDGAQGINH